MLCGEIFVINIKIKHCVDAGWCIITRAATKRPLRLPTALISFRLYLFSLSTSLSLCIKIFLSAHLFIPSLTSVFPAHIFLCLSFTVNLPYSLSPFSFTCPFSYPSNISFLALPSPLRHQLYTHRLCFHGVSHRFWQSALETQDHFK